MLTRILQLFAQKRVAPSVEEEVFRQNEDLQRIKRDIATIETQLSGSLEILTKMQIREDELRSQIECVLLEIHDPMLIRQDQLTAIARFGEDGYATQPELEHAPFHLKDAVTTMCRIREVVELPPKSHSETEDDSDEGGCSERVVNRRKNRLEWKGDGVEKGRCKKLPFVVLAEHSDVDDERSSSTSVSEEDGLNPTTVVSIDRESALRSSHTDELPEEKLHTVVHLQRLKESDFASPSEWCRWQLQFGRWQQAQLLEQHFRGKILKEVMQRREELESKIFARRCDLIHMKAFEENAERQLKSSGIRVLDRDEIMLMNRSSGENGPSVVIDDPPSGNIQLSVT